MITRINDLKTLRKHILCKYKCKFHDSKCNLNQKWQNEKFRYACKNWKEHHVCEKDYIWNPATCNCENGNYLGRIIDN